MRRIAFLLCALLLLTGCGAPEAPQEDALKEWALGKARDALDTVTGTLGEGIMRVLDGIREADYTGGPFENDLDSARAYLLAQLEEKYGVPFMVVGRENLVNYGAIAGASYTCEAAPVDAPQQVTTALVSQTMYRQVRDGYAVWFFREEAEAPAQALCETKDYAADRRVSLEMPETERRWHPEDGAEKFFAESGAYVKLVLRFPEDAGAQAYAEYLEDFIHSVENLPCDVLLQARAGDVYIFHKKLSILDGFDADAFTVEDLRESIEENLQMGAPR